MDRKSKSTINLTPLLDIILIVLFLVLLGTYNKATAFELKSSSLDLEKTDLEARVEMLEELLNQSDDKNKLLSEEFDKLRRIREREQESINNLMDSFSEILDSGKSDISDLMDTYYSQDRESLVKELEKLLDKENLIKQLNKYHVISKKVFFLEIAIATADNELYLNSESTGFSIGTPHSVSGSEYTRQRVVDLVEDRINQEEGGVGMILVALTWLDDDVDKSAFDLVWNAIKDLEKTYGNTRLFKTQYGYFN